MNRSTNFLADFSKSILAVSAAAILVSFCAPAPAHAKCTASDKWRGPDKVLHAQAGAMIGAVGALNNGSFSEGVAWAAIAGAGKELADATGAGQCSLQDFLVTIAGGALGAGLGKGVYLTLDPRAKSVQVGINIALGN